MTKVTYRRPRFDPWSGRSPGEGNGCLLQYSCLGNSMGRGAWPATVHGVAESDATEQLTHTHTHTHTHIFFLISKAQEINIWNNKKKCLQISKKRAAKLNKISKRVSALYQRKSHKANKSMKRGSHSAVNWELQKKVMMSYLCAHEHDIQKQESGSR